MKEVLVLQHEACEDLGRIKVALKARGLIPRYVRLFAGEGIPSALESAEALIAMGGPMSVYEQEQYPFLTAELELIHRTISSGRPILGVCLGSQLLSAALGGAVSKGERKEIGWYRCASAIRRHRIHFCSESRKNSSGFIGTETSLHFLRVQCRWLVPQ